MKKKLAIIGGGPGALFLFKRLVENKRTDFTVDLFEATDRLGSGMPYSTTGANREHVTNVSGNEIPELITSVEEWIRELPEEKLAKYAIDLKWFNEYMVLPRLLFGEYLHDQFVLLLEKAAQTGIQARVHFHCRVLDLVDLPEKNKLSLELEGKGHVEFDSAVICTGHAWPLENEGRVPGYFDSPYPPAKLKIKINHTVSIRGSSLTAIDAIRTLSRENGVFTEESPHALCYQRNPGSEQFKIEMHSRHGLLPGIRFHLDDPHLSKESLLTRQEIEDHRKTNDGFLSLDYIFEKDFKEVFRTRDPAFYEFIRSFSLEEFVDSMMSFREAGDPFIFFKAEYEEARQSIRKRKSVYWKEALAILSFAINYPAKHFSAEDMQRLQQTLMPLISIIIAFVPQRSCEELIALHEAGVLELIQAGNESRIEAQAEGGIIFRYRDEAGVSQEKRYQTYIDCSGQKHLNAGDFPFKSMVKKGTVRDATLVFRSSEKGLFEKKQGNTDVREINGQFYLKVPGIDIDDHFRVVEKNGNHHPRIHMMAVSFMGGLNPDYSGLDFSEEASGLIVPDLH